VTIDGGEGPDSVALGGLGGLQVANLNAGETAPDADVTLGRAFGRGHKSIEGFELNGNGGSDVLSLSGGAGFDRAAPRHVSLSGGPGDDLILGSPRDDELTGESGNDTLLGLAGADSLAGGDGDDTISGKGAPDLLLGLKGSDRILGGGGRDLVLPGPGRDRVNCGGGRDYFDRRQRRDRRRRCELLTSFAGLFR
jgi:Ca2+-binding RTX toxin-like protein